MTTDAPLSNNTLALLGLCNEYCATLENLSDADATTLTDSMLRLLPRIYITMDGTREIVSLDGDGYITPALDEDSYNRVRDNIATIYGSDDTFLEVFEHDMRYSDTPIGASISELLADIFQALYDFVETCRDSPNDLINEAVAALRDTFENYWSQTLVNVLRPLNALKYN